MIKHSITFSVILWTVFNTFSQSSTGSAYNMYGLGKLTDYGLGSFQSKGNAGIGARFTNEVNLKNPASLNAILGPTHIFDFGLSMTSLSQKTDQISEQTTIGSLSNLNFWLKLGKSTAITFGASPFSDARYDITDEFRTSDILDFYSVRFTGSGGLTQFYLAASQKVFRNFNVGVRGSFLSGHISSTQQIYNNDIIGNVELYQGKSTSEFIADFGVQYAIPLGVSKSLTLGAIYQPKYRVVTDTESKIIQNNTDSLTTTGSGRFYLPEMYGVGLSMNIKKLTVSIDSKLEKWNVNNAGEGFTYKDRWINSLGFEYLNNSFGETYFERIAYRWGFTWDDQYLSIRSGDLTGLSGSLGLGLPVERGAGMLNIGYSYHRIQPSSSRMITEISHKITLNISIRDLWFREVKYD